MMSNVIVDKSKIDILANAISCKSGEPVTMTLDEMVSAVDGIETGITPTGNIDITQAGTTDVTNYATATVPQGAVLGPVGSYSTVTRSWAASTTEFSLIANVPTTPNVTEGYVTSALGSSRQVTLRTTAFPIDPAPTVSEGTVTTPSGIYTIDTTTTVASGTAGTPTATKGTVSNHSVTVTPSVTNTAGYISGGTKTGTGVSVTASELVSGTYTVSASGSHDVTNYASASVASGTATASATKGTVSNHSVTVTPSVTRTAGYITAGSASGTAVTVSASELVSGSQTITQNGTVDVTNLASVVVDVQGGGGSSAQVDTAMRAPGGDDYTAIFTGLKGQPTSFYVSTDVQISTTAQALISAVVYDGSSIHTQTITNTTNAQVSYVSTGVSYTYSNGTLTVTSTGPIFVDDDYALTYTYGGSASDVDTFNVQVGSGATSITFTGLEDEPIAWSCIFKSNFSTSSGYQRVIATGYNGTSVIGLAMDSAAHPSNSYWTQSYNNGSLTITSQGTNAGGYFHQPGYYQLTAVYGEIEPQEIDVVPLSVTTNGTYTAPSGTAYSPVTVNVSGGGASIATATMTNNNNQSTSIAFTLPSGRTPKAFFARLTSQIARNSSSRYYYVYDMRWDGSSTGGVAGNTFYMYNGTLTNVTSGYSYSQSGTTFTLSSTGSRSASPGSFYNGTYELTYIY